MIYAFAWIVSAFGLFMIFLMALGGLVEGVKGVISGVRGRWGGLLALGAFVIVWAALIATR
jgi:hypothetical protein